MFFSRRCSEIRVCGIACATLAIVLLLCGSAIPEDGNKARIAVGVIEDKADGCSASKAKSLGEMLENALENCDRFVVTAEMDDVNGSGGQMPNVDIIITGKVKKFVPEKKQGGVFGGLKKKAMDAMGTDAKTAEIEWELQVYDSHSGKVIDKIKKKGKSTDWSANASRSVLSSEIGSFGELSTFAGEPMEDAIKELLSKTVDEVSKITPKEYFKYTGTETYGATTTETPAQPQASGTTPGGKQGGVSEDMQLFTKYDFIPGNKVLYYDDMANEEVGEFPYRWNLIRGVFEVVKLGGEFWIMATDDGKIAPKYPKAPLPDKYTAELEFYDHGSDHRSNFFQLDWVDQKGNPIGYFIMQGKAATSVGIKGRTMADKRLPKEIGKGVHIMRVMATTRSIKCYVDEERVANIPKVEDFNPYGFQFYFRPYSDQVDPTLFRGFRFAEGGKTMREQLDETGKIVTHGILFDSGSWTIKGQSYKTLKEIGELLTEDTSLRLSIEGHTDSDGDDASNNELSQKRAESVRTYLSSTYDISGDRLEAKGWGESKPIDTNNTSEGKANNRRVELVKL